MPTDRRPQLRVVAHDAPAAGGAAATATLDEAFRRYAPYVARIALRLLGRSSELEDVVQDVFADAVKGLDQLREPEAIKGWLAVVTVRVATRRLRLRRLQRWIGLGAAPELETLTAPGATAEDRVLLANVYRELERLPVAARTAWILRCMEGLPLEQVAEICGCSLATLKRRVAAVQVHIDEAFHDE